MTEQTLWQQFAIIGIAIFTTQLSRWLPFIIFKNDNKIPNYVKYLGKVLPGAIFGLLVIYCYKDVKLLEPPYGFPEIFSGLLVVILQLVFKNMLLSMFVGTATYVYLVNFVFV